MGGGRNIAKIRFLWISWDAATSFPNCHHASTASCHFTCVRLQCSMQLQAHMDPCMVAFQCHRSAMWRWSQRRTRTLTSYLNTARLWTHLFIDNLESHANRAGVMSELLSSSGWVSYIMKTDCCQILNNLDRVEMDRGTCSNMVTKFSTSNSL